MTRFHITMVASLIVLSMPACRSSSGLITSLEDLTSDTQRVGFIDLNQNRIISVNGLLPQGNVGGFYRYKDSRPPSTAFGVTPTRSFQVESVIEGPCFEDLLPIRNSILVARSKASDAIAKRLAVTRARARLVLEQDKDEPEDVAGLQSELEAAIAAYDSARSAFEEALTEAVKAVDQNGVMVMRWDTRDRASGSTLGVSGERDTATSGFAILSGLRTMTLFAGTDLKDYKPGVDETFTWIVGRFPWLFGWVYDDIRLTTFVLQTKHVLYLQDVEISQRVEVALETSYEQLGNIGKTLRELDKIEIQGVLDSLASLSNLGIMGVTKRTAYPIELTPDLGGPVSTEEDQSGTDPANDDRNAFALQLTGSPLGDRPKSLTLDGWTTIYVVDTDLSTLQDRISRISSQPTTATP